MIRKVKHTIFEEGFGFRKLVTHSSNDWVITAVENLNFTITGRVDDEKVKTENDEFSLQMNWGLVEESCRPIKWEDKRKEGNFDRLMANASTMMKLPEDNTSLPDLGKKIVMAKIERVDTFVPAKLVELYLDLRKSTEEQVRRERGWRTFKRPGVDDFLKRLAQYYKIVVYSDQLNMAHLSWGLNNPISLKFVVYN
ncbi:hypothetical protein RJ640_000808 [Escallonia rubra]|uniref:FCP1 homology domain-containing protein n=1 Tax=Escallonia rubra TaxID=112253 RepID=A0AA88RVA8_9ASTE|nr:hypothetical protein RJ640_000808 [Escallonia rubra]